MPSDPSIFQHTPRLSYFREQGLEVTHVAQTLSAVAADASVANALGVVQGSPLLSLTRRSYRKTGAESEQIMDQFRNQMAQHLAHSPTSAKQKPQSKPKTVKKAANGSSSFFSLFRKNARPDENKIKDESNEIDENANSEGQMTNRYRRG